MGFSCLAVGEFFLILCLPLALLWGTSCVFAMVGEGWDFMRFSFCSLSFSLLIGGRGLSQSLSL